MMKSRFNFGAAFRKFSCALSNAQFDIDAGSTRQFYNFFERFTKIKRKRATNVRGE